MLCLLGLRGVIEGTEMFNGAVRPSGINGSKAFSTSCRTRAIAGSSGAKRPSFVVPDGTTEAVPFPFVLKHNSWVGKTSKPVSTWHSFCDLLSRGVPKNSNGLR
jgi:hypothetical protein